jgi:hypothetical protein
VARWVEAAPSAAVSILEDQVGALGVTDAALGEVALEI